jgi:hypothetical protein
LQPLNAMYGMSLFYVLHDHESERSPSAASRGCSMPAPATKQRHTTEEFVADVSQTAGKR